MLSRLQLLHEGNRSFQVMQPAVMPLLALQPKTAQISQLLCMTVFNLPVTLLSQ